MSHVKKYGFRYHFLRRRSSPDLSLFKLHSMQSICIYIANISADLLTCLILKYKYILLLENLYLYCFDGDE